MTIDLETRKRYMEDTKMKTLVNGMKDSIIAAVQNNAKSGENEEVLKLVVKREEEKELIDKVGKLGQALAMVYAIIKKPLILPKIFQIKGQVEVTRQPAIEVKNLNELKKYFESLETTFNKLLLAMQSMPQPQVKLPTIKIPEVIRSDNTELIKSFQELADKMDNFQPQSNDTLISAVGKVTAAINDLYNKPTMIPQPVTNVFLNPNNGVVKTSDNTVGTTPVSLPQYGQLFDRRSVLIYNNSANTIYIGGSDVTTSNGLPVPASSYAPPIDAGYNLKIFGVASQGGNDVRVIEVSKDLSGTIQE